MTQERLDQSCRLPLGTRDAIHVPIVSAQLAHIKREPGNLEEWIRMGNQLQPRLFRQVC